MWPWRVGLRSPAGCSSKGSGSGRRVVTARGLLSNRQGEQMATSDYTEEFYAKLHDFKFDAFNEEIEDWDNYIGRFELKLKVKGLGDISPRANALKRDLLVSSLTARHFQLLREQVGGDLEALTFQDVCQAMASRYRKKRNPFVKRREFYKCVGGQTKMFDLSRGANQDAG
ncbi:hypothetical protein RF11_08981 [Thelohanellus kitauei]|uniref:Uncharacterized protein n=1 Tax=Thelohanellus kitauei TaxID=669202 RepID=A0A0C2M6Z1_THEKT|nr:hypothetical protein RF11_08981 [Thelohanellus kitauei]